MPEKTEVRIGVTWSGSGWCWLDCRFIQTGPRLWVEETNAKGGMYVPEAGRRLPVRLIAYDDESSVEREIELVTRLVERDRIDLFLSSGASELQSQILSITDKHEVLNLNISSPDHRLFELGAKYQLLGGPPLKDNLQLRPAFWRTHGLTRIAHLHQDGWGWTGVAGPLPDYIEQEDGLELVHREAIPNSQQWSTQYGPFPKDFDGWGEIVERLQAARPDAVVIGLPSPAEYRLMREMRRRGVWFKYLEMNYTMFLDKVGFGPEDLLYQFSGGGVFPPVDPASINVGGTVQEIQAKCRSYLPGIDPRQAYTRGYVGLCLWEHLVRQAGGMEAPAVMEQSLKESGKITTLFGPVSWAPNGELSTDRRSGVAQVQRHPETAELHSVIVYPELIAQGTPVFTETPYENRPDPWTGAW